MDFVTGLPLSDSHDAIWVVVDRLTKQRHLVPCSTAVDAEELATLFIREIFRLHGLPRTIISDRGPQFASRFWKHLCSCLSIDPRLSTAFHPQPDGQTERMNATMEQYLRAYVNYQQDDWVKFLPITEFAANNQTSETTGLSPFYGTYGLDLRTSYELDVRVDNPEEAQAQLVAERLQAIHEVLRTEMAYAQARYQDNADRRRIAAPAYRIGDRVWLDARNIRTHRPCRNLDHRRLGPFAIKRIVSSHAYELELPRGIDIHPVQPVSLLDLAADDPLPGQRSPPPPPVIVQEWFVEQILDSRVFRRQLQYLVKWTGDDLPTWQPWWDVDEAAAVDVFHGRHPDKPAPHA